MPLFEVRGLTHFFGGLRAVSDFNLTFEGGELMGLIGPNGAGKTTIFNLVCGVYHPTHGEVRIEGRNLVRRYPHQVTAMGVARTFQNIRLWPEMTVLDNIRVAHNYKLNYGFLDAIFQTSRYRRVEKEIDQKAEEVLELMGLREYTMELAKNLPYGLQRKVEIARALVIRPKLLLLDEPSLGLAPIIVDTLADVIKEISKEGIDILLVEQNAGLAFNLVDLLFLLEVGRIVLTGKTQEIMNDEKVRKAFLGG